MSRPDDVREPLDRDDALLVARMRESYAPEALTPARRAAFDATLRERIESRRARPAWLPALGGALAAAALAAVLLLRGGAEPTEAPVQIARDTSAPFAEALLTGDAVEYASAGWEDDHELPPQYAAIASVLLDD